MRAGLTVAALVAALLLGGCGSSGKSSSTGASSVTQPAATHIVTGANGNTSVNGRLEHVAKGTRRACYHQWAKEFAPGEQRRALLSQCKNLPQ
jgi:hypothetical protein